MQLIFGLDQEVADYIAYQFPIIIERGGFDPDLAIGLAHDSGKMAGGFVLTDYTGHDGEITIFLEEKIFIEGIFKFFINAI